MNANINNFDQFFFRSKKIALQLKPYWIKWKQKNEMVCYFECSHQASFISQNKKKVLKLSAANLCSAITSGILSSLELAWNWFKLKNIMHGKKTTISQMATGALLKSKMPNIHEEFKRCFHLRLKLCIAQRHICAEL